MVHRFRSGIDLPPLTQGICVFGLRWPRQGIHLCYVFLLFCLVVFWELAVLGLECQLEDCDHTQTQSPRFTLPALYSPQRHAWRNCCLLRLALWCDCEWKVFLLTFKGLSFSLSGLHGVRGGHHNLSFVVKFVHLNLYWRLSFISMCMS